MWAGATKVAGTEHVEDEDERKASWACRGREGEGWRDGRGVEVAAGWWGGERERRSVERKRQMERGAAERGAGTQPLFWLLSLRRRFWGSSARFARSACPPARLDAASRPRQCAAAFLSAQTLLSPSLNHYSLVLVCAPPRLVFTSTTSRVGLVPRCGPPSALLTPLFADCPDVMVRTNTQRGGAMVHTNTHTNTITQRVQRWFHAI